MDPAESLENHQSGVFHEFFEAGNEEKVVKQYGVTFVKLLPGTVKIKIDIKMLDEFGDRIPVRVRFLLNYLY